MSEEENCTHDEVEVHVMVSQQRNFVWDEELKEYKQVLSIDRKGYWDVATVVCRDCAAKLPYSKLAEREKIYHPNLVEKV